MALQKSHTTAQGVAVDYWRISNVRLYYDDTTPYAYIELQMYVDAAARTGGSDPVDTFDYRVEDPDYATYFAASVLDVLNQNPQERAYEYLKTLSTPVDFTTGTTDV